MAIIDRVGKVAYGCVFTVLLPLMFACWAWRLDRSEMAFWPIPFPFWMGVLMILAGFGMMLVAIHALWVKGKGLPMNAYPPPHYVASSIYAFLSHPIYVGFVCMVAGVSILLDSPAGFWVVVPIAALASMALVVGYEGPRLRERFGHAAIRSPLFGVPEANEKEASWTRRITACALALGPWAIFYSIFSLTPVPKGAIELRMAWEYGIPVVGWMIWPYSAAYPFAIMGPLLLRTNGELRRYLMAAWLATLLGFMLMLVVPGRATLLPLYEDGMSGWLVAANRALDADWLALPSFHVIWVVLAFYCFTSRFARLRMIWASATAIVGISCILTGSHAIADVFAGALLGALCWHHKMAWRWLLHGAEKLGNSWSAVQIGPVRIINHALWSAIAAAAGIEVVIWLTGTEFISRIMFVFVVALVAAGAWGYWLEGGSRLSRPFGYYGFLLGAVIAITILLIVDRPASEVLMASFACGAPLAQAIGRVRCLVQGCCHGRPVVGASGICVTHPESRVTALGHLNGISIHPTPLYSIIGNLFVFACLWRLWLVGAASTFIGGLYLVLSSLARFVEEGYRGEPQTARFFGLAVYQWLAVIFFVSGIAISMFGGLPMNPVSSATMRGVIASLVAGLIAAALMSMDLPHSHWRFSRLTVQRRGDL